MNIIHKKASHRAAVDIASFWGWQNKQILAKEAVAGGLKGTIRNKILNLVALFVKS